MAAAFVQVNGQTVAAFTRSDGDVIVFSAGQHRKRARRPAARAADRPAHRAHRGDPWDGEPGNQELVVGKLGGTADQVLKWRERRA